MQASNGGRGRWSRDGYSRSDHVAVGIGTEEWRTSHPEQSWSEQEWREWDKKHGHILWMGSIQEHWTNAKIAGFFRAHGLNSIITRKEGAGYCFVEFESAEEAKDFMSTYNHQPLPGNDVGDGCFNMRPRTRPRWCRQNDGWGEGNQQSDGKYVDRDGGNRRTHDTRGEGGNTGCRNTRRNCAQDQDNRWARGSDTRAWSSSATQSDRGKRRTSSDGEDRNNGRQSESPVRWRAKSSWSRSRSRSQSRSRSRERNRRQCDSSLRKRPVAQSANADERSPRLRPQGVLAIGRGDRGTYGNTISRVGARTKEAGCGNTVASLPNSRSQLIRAKASAAEQASRDGEQRTGKVQGILRRTNETCVKSRVKKSLLVKKSNGCVASARHNVQAKDGGADGSGASSGARKSVVSDEQKSTLEETETKVRDNEAPSIHKGAHAGTSNVIPAPLSSNLNEHGVNRDNGMAGHLSCENELPSPSSSEGTDIPENKWAPPEISKKNRIYPCEQTKISAKEDCSLERELGQPATSSKLTGNEAGISHVGGTTRDSTLADTETVENNLVCASTPPTTRAVVSTDDATDSVVSPDSKSGRETDDRSSVEGHGSGISTGSDAIKDGPMGASVTTKAVSVRERIGDVASEKDNKIESKKRAFQGANDATVALEAGKRRRSSPATSPPSTRRSPPSSTSPISSVPSGVGMHAPPAGSSSLFSKTGLEKGCAVTPGDVSIHGQQVVQKSQGGEGKQRARAERRVDEDSNDIGCKTGDTRVRSNFITPGATDGNSVKCNVKTDSTPMAKRATKSAQANGLSRHMNTEITLAQVMDHHMARRRANALNNRSTVSGDRDKSFGGEGDGHGSSPSSVKVGLDPENVVAAAWANGEILPLSAAVAPHMRLVAPVLASEPEGWAIVVRTASAIAAGAIALSLPGYRLEVTGMSSERLMLELYPSADLHDGRDSPELCLFADRLQSAFRRLVALDLELDSVLLPHAEALKLLPSASSSAQLLQWCNNGTVNVLCLEPEPASDSPGGDTDGSSMGSGIARRGAQRGGQVLGLDCDMGPLLPRTGLLQCFEAEVYPLQSSMPAKAVSGGNCKSRSTNVHLELKLGGAPASVGVFQKTRSMADINRGKGGTRAHEDVTLSTGDAKFPCRPRTCMASGFTWLEVIGLGCVADVNRLAIQSRRELEGKVLLAEGVHAAQIQELAARIVASGILLVTLGGRQGAMTHAVASRLCIELTINGKKPAMLDTESYVHRATSPTQALGGETRGAAVRMSAPHLDSSALGSALAALLGQARAGAGLLGAGGGTRAGETGAAAAASREWRDIVIVHGSQALDTALLPPEGFGLGSTEAFSVFIDTIPQVSVDSLTPVSGAHVRMLRLLVKSALRESASTANDLAAPHGHSLSTASFLERWLIGEAREERLWQSFSAAADAHVNTALPYDLHIMKPLVEPLLRSVPPPMAGVEDGGDGCRSPTYALARAILRVLRLCEPLPALVIPETSFVASLMEYRGSWSWR